MQFPSTVAIRRPAPGTGVAVEPDEVTAEMQVAIVKTAIEHHLVSKHTSLIAVDKTPVRPDSEALGRDQVPNLLPHGQSQQAILGFAATATPAPLQRMLGALCLVLAMFVWLGRIMGHRFAPVTR